MACRVRGALEFHLGWRHVLHRWAGDGLGGVTVDMIGYWARTRLIDRLTLRAAIMAVRLEDV